MKVAFDISQLVYRGTGVANYTKNVVENLITHDEVEVVLFGSSLRKYDRLLNYYNSIKNLGNVKAYFYRLPQSFLSLLWNNLHLFNIDHLLPPIDIFHSSDWIQPPTTAKKITTIHDLVVYKYEELSHPYIVKTQKKRLEWVKKECDLISADSLATKNDIVDILNIDPQKIAVIYPGVDKKYFPQNGKEIARIKEKYKIDGDYMLSVGTQEPRKNIEKVIHAFELFLKQPKIISNNKRVELLLVGKIGWGNNTTLPKSIRALGYVEDEDLPAIYSGAKIFVYPSLYEGFGLPILEAMACAVPVITSARGSLQEVADDAAIFVDPDDINDIGAKLTNLYLNIEKQEKMKKLGILQSQKFNWQKTSEQLISLYKKLLF